MLAGADYNTRATFFHRESTTCVDGNSVGGVDKKKTFVLKSKFLQRKICFCLYIFHENAEMT